MCPETTYGKSCQGKPIYKTLRLILPVPHIDGQVWRVISTKTSGIGLRLCRLMCGKALPYRRAYLSSTARLRLAHS